MSNAALVQPEKFAPQEIQNLSIPIPEPTEVVIRVKAAALNPVDWKLVKYGVIIPSWPTIMGLSGSGEVYAIGSSVTNRKVGDRVIFNGAVGKIRYNAFQQYAAIPSEFAFQIPDSLSFDDASTLTVPGITTAVALFKGLKLAAPWEAGAEEKNKGKTVLIWGAATTAGYYCKYCFFLIYEQLSDIMFDLAVQIAKRSGATVIATASASNHAEIKANGADHVFDYRDPEILSKIRSLVGNSLYLAFDTVGPISAQNCFNLLSSDSKATLILIASYLPDLKNKEEFPLREVLDIFGNNYMHPELASVFWPWWISEIEKGGVKIQESKYIGGLTDIIKGQEDQIAGNVSNAKLVVRP
ncbi:hypothetical protein HK096_010869 [Nowakowskiella sp. JEL0078]|nr:hypothetical protein HK096_010869 [Nowakowskiella sp. JEL0078]